MILRRPDTPATKFDHLLLSHRRCWPDIWRELNWMGGNVVPGLVSAPPFDIDRGRDTAWPAAMKPEGEGERFDKERFTDWWDRLRPQLDHLPMRLCEQWVYRHWIHSPFAFLPLDTLGCRIETWPGEMLLARVYRAWGGPLHPRFDYDTFQRSGATDRLQTAVELDTGSWIYPMVLLGTPHGVIDGGESHPDARYVIVEGHQRHRYLNALHALGQPPAGPHEVFVLTSPIVAPVGDVYLNELGSEGSIDSTAADAATS